MPSNWLKMYFITRNRTTIENNFYTGSILIFFKDSNKNKKGNILGHILFLHTDTLT